MKKNGLINIDMTIRFFYSFCLITDFQIMAEAEMEKILIEAISGGVDLIQYRDINAPPDVSLKRLRLISAITRARGVALIVNGDFPLPVELHVDGFHVKSKNIEQIPSLRKQHGGTKLIGASVHNESEIIEAEKKGADYLMLSPLFSPGSKNSSLPILTPEKFKELSQLTGIPVFALGGITSDNVHIPILNGATGVAMITGLLKSGNIRLTASDISKKIALSRLLVTSQ